MGWGLKGIGFRVLLVVKVRCWGSGLGYMGFTCNRNIDLLGPIRLTYESWMKSMTHRLNSWVMFRDTMNL